MTSAPDLAHAMPIVAIHFWGKPNPAHSNKKELRWGKNGSCSVDVAKGVWHDHEANEGGGVIDLLKREGVPDPWQWLREHGFAEHRDNGAGSDTRPRIVARYDYRDETGELLFQVRRSDPKTFRQCRPDGKGGWIWNLDGVTRVLYRLPELIKAIANEHRVFIVEGEKDVETLAALGIDATCNPGGAGKWNDSYSYALRGADVIVIPDNDDAGSKHADQIATALAGKAARVRRLELPGLADKGDVSDWFAAGGTVEGFNALVDRVPEQDKVGDCLSMLDVTAWEGVAVPPRDWAVRDRLVRRAVALLSGEGGIGKSILILQLACAHVLGRDWFGSLPEPGPVLYLNAEDDERELHFRLEAIRIHLGTSFANLGDLHLVPLAGEDALLGVPDQRGIIQPTPLFNRLLQTADKIQPVLIALDTAADMFGGNENDRSQVRQFIGLLRRLAITGNAAVLLASHPSLSGINSDSGLSGSTGWHNSVRSRLFFKASETNDDGTSNQRELIVRKNNYGPSGEIVRMVWRNGVFVPVAVPSSQERADAEREAESLFLQLLEKQERNGDNVSPKRTSNNFAPSVFAKTPEARKAHFGRQHFEDALDRLVASGRVDLEPYGPPSREYRRIIRKAAS
jgi:RecA-family ATPase/5S rRNA maturation endonuclease (ribonuclease M5)